MLEYENISQQGEDRQFGGSVRAGGAFLARLLLSLNLLSPSATGMSFVLPTACTGDDGEPVSFPQRKTYILGMDSRLGSIKNHAEVSL